MTQDEGLWFEVDRACSEFTPMPTGRCRHCGTLLWPHVIKGLLAQLDELTKERDRIMEERERVQAALDHI